MREISLNRFGRLAEGRTGYVGGVKQHAVFWLLLNAANDKINFAEVLIWQDLKYKMLISQIFFFFYRFFGRRACIRGYEDNSEEAKSLDDEASKKEIKSSKDKKEDKSKKLKF